MTSIINSLLDSDAYKFSMGNVVFQRFPNADVEYEFKCRNKGVDLTPYIEEINSELDSLCSLRFTPNELSYLRSIKYLSSGYVDALEGFRLNRNNIVVGKNEGELTITIRGNWFQTILFEVPVLAIVNEVYFRNTVSFDSVRVDGTKRLIDKVEILKKSDIPFYLIEFGTRRRFCQKWQNVVMKHLVEASKENNNFNLVGTSNVALAHLWDVKPIGTMAHEYLQAMQVFAPLKDFQKYAFETWMQVYRGNNGIALSDVVGMNAFFNDFDMLFCKAYDGARHDSGDPYIWGDRLIEHYKNNKVNPITKQAVFSDSLDISKAMELNRYFNGKIMPSFGIGTNLTADMGVPALNIVIKMTKCNGLPVAKLSDSPGKEMCKDKEYVVYLKRVFNIKELK